MLGSNFSDFNQKLHLQCTFLTTDRVASLHFKSFHLQEMGNLSKCCIKISFEYEVGCKKHVEIHVAKSMEIY